MFVSIKEKMFKSSVLPVAGALVFAVAGSAGAEMVSVTDADGNDFGDTSGFAIDFNTNTTGAVWSPGLVAGNDYTLDSVTVFDGGEAGGTAYYLGVYTTLTTKTAAEGGVDELGGFLGASTNSIDFADLGNNDAATYAFSGIEVTADATPGSGSGVLYFAFQSVNTAISNVIDGLEVQVRRIDGNDGTFADELSAIIQPNGGSDLILTRSPEYEASVSAVSSGEIPEPATALGLLVGMGVLGLRRRRALVSAGRR